MVVNQTYCGGHVAIYINTKLLLCTSETNITYQLHLNKKEKTSTEVFFFMIFYLLALASVNYSTEKQIFNNGVSGTTFTRFKLDICRKQSKGFVKGMCPSRIYHHLSTATVSCECLHRFHAFECSHDTMCFVLATIKIPS